MILLLHVSSCETNNKNKADRKYMSSEIIDIPQVQYQLEQIIREIGQYEEMDICNKWSKIYKI